MSIENTIEDVGKSTQEDVENMRKKRASSDIELEKGGAKVTDDGKIFPTEDQQKDAKIEMGDENRVIEEFIGNKEISSIDEVEGEYNKAQTREVLSLLKIV